MAEIDEYRQWLASGMSDTALIQTVDIYHPATGHLYLANWAESIDCQLETGATETFLASRFEFSEPEVNDTTEQSTRFMMSSVGGVLYERLLGLTYEDRRVPFDLTYRLYLSNDLTTQLVVPPPIWQITSVDAAVDTISCEVNTQRLRTGRIGTYFTRREFPVLVYL